MKRPKASMAGAVTGFVVFLVAGALPTIVFAAQMGILLAGVLFGRPLEPSGTTQLFIIGSMVIGVVAIASLFIVAGAVIGGLLGSFVTAVRVDHKPIAGVPAIRFEREPELAEEHQVETETEEQKTVKA